MCHVSCFTWDVWSVTCHLVLVRIDQNNAQLHNLHVEQHKYEQCLILLVLIHNCAMHNTHLMHNIVLLCMCVLIFQFLKNYAQFIVHVLYIKGKMQKSTIPQQTCTIQINRVLYLALFRFVVHSSARVLCIACNCCALCIRTNTNVTFFFYSWS